MASRPISSTKAGAPAVTDDLSKGYDVGSLIVNTSPTPRTIYLCMDASLGAAVWILVCPVDTTVQPALAATSLTSARGLLGFGQVEVAAGHNVLGFTAPLVNGTYLWISDRAYFVYMGYCRDSITVKHVEFRLSALAVGTQAAEVGLASSPAAPNGATQSMTKLIADGTLDDLTATLTIKRNTTAFNTTGYVVAAGTHLWAMCRAQFTVGPTQPTSDGIIEDYNEGSVLITSTASALTGTGPWTATVNGITNAVAGSPSIRATRF